MKWILQCLVLFYLGDVALSHFQIPGKPIVVLPEFTVHGIKNTTNKGTDAFLYLGIPYAKPPVRFEKAEPLPITLLTPLKQVDAKKWKAACHQVVDVSDTTVTSEDCLYLNVFTPTNSTKKNLPVYIFIHGGGYSYGYTQAYGYEYFVDNFISQDIIMVTLQYRLAHF
uniref:Carboxylesterase type B domain-containing protein n=1 Tax=Panagrolaimus sp. ES5 TaxID=591445 RepID=A0AC34G0N7_9BILA